VVPAGSTVTPLLVVPTDRRAHSLFVAVVTVLSRDKGPAAVRGLV